jgi:hypothetical protein
MNKKDQTERLRLQRIMAAADGRLQKREEEVVFVDTL